MFNDWKTFKDATKSAFLQVKSNKNMSITEFRTKLATEFTNYPTLEAFQASIDNKFTKTKSTQDEKVRDLISDDRLSLSELYDLFMTSRVEVNNSGKISKVTMNEHCFRIEVFEDNKTSYIDVEFLSLEHYEIKGDEFLFADDVDDEFSVKFHRNFFAEKPSSQYSFIRIAMEKGDDVLEHIIYLNDINARENTFQQVVMLMEDHCSNFDEYTSDDIDKIIENGKENIGSKTLIVEMF